MQHFCYKLKNLIYKPRKHLPHQQLASVCAIDDKGLKGLSACTSRLSQEDTLASFFWCGLVRVMPGRVGVMRGRVGVMSGCVGVMSGRVGAAMPPPTITICRGMCHGRAQGNDAGPSQVQCPRAVAKDMRRMLLMTNDSLCHRASQKFWQRGSREETCKKNFGSRRRTWPIVVAQAVGILKCIRDGRSSRAHAEICGKNI